MVLISDGIGRSGAYLLIDMVINKITKGAKEIDLSATLEYLRDQRANIVSKKVNKHTFNKFNQFKMIILNMSLSTYTNMHLRRSRKS
jgi:deoxyribose-phosphate aldolase